MSKTYIADKETLDGVKADTGAILEGLEGIGAVKSVQTGAISRGSGTSTITLGSEYGINAYLHYRDVTISEVDVSKTVAICNIVQGVEEVTETVAAYLLNSTTLRVFVKITKSGSSPASYGICGHICWQVVEFN